MWEPNTRICYLTEKKERSWPFQYDAKRGDYIQYNFLQLAEVTLTHIATTEEETTNHALCNSKYIIFIYLTSSLDLVDLVYLILNYTLSLC